MARVRGLAPVSRSGLYESHHSFVSRNACWKHERPLLKLPTRPEERLSSVSNAALVLLMVNLEHLTIQSPFLQVSPYLKLLSAAACPKGRSATTLAREIPQDAWKPSTEDKTTGKLHEVKGAIKQKAGELTSNPNLAADGRAEMNDGKVQNAVGKIEKAAGV
jgi:uncharacterized protein YjbJ (UPF0337 family)